jgi:hypothetical protein
MRRQMREVDAMIVRPAGVRVHVGVADREQRSDAPGAEEQYIASEAVADPVTVTFEDAFSGAGVRAEFRPKSLPAPVEAREPEPVPETVFHAEEEVEPDSHAESEPVVDTSTCNIALWRGYRKAMFYAQTFDSNGDAVALAESPMFKYSGNGIPDQTDAAVQAYKALVELLKDEGWQTAEHGPAWFDQTLTQA